MLVLPVLILIINFVLFRINSYEEVTDISKYQEVIGKNSKDNFEIKWGMSEEIFPDKITEDMDVLDFKSIYYNPWDAQYLSILEIKYNEEDYINEIERLNNFESTDYLGYYGVTGFNKNYTLSAMHADPYHGFVYAITDNKDRVVYIEMIFCNYFMDLDYDKYIDKDYLPLGFDATANNSYRKEKLGK